MAAMDRTVAVEADRIAKQRRAEFGDYESAVTFISSIQAWLEENWGSGSRLPSTLVKFDRFPEIAGSTPDFLATFNTPYVLCGEHIKNFRSPGSDLAQVMKYSVSVPGAVAPAACDIIVLVGTHTAHDAVEAISAARKATKGAPRLPARIAVVGFLLDAARVNGEWYDLKWYPSPRKNQRFAKRNVTGVVGSADLNSLLVSKKHCAVKVDRQALALAGRVPLINDPPPPIYTVVRIIMPVACDLLTEDNRDDLASTGRTEVVISCADVVEHYKPAVIKTKPLGEAFAFMQRWQLAKRVPESDPPKYAVLIDRRGIRRELAEWLPETEAKSLARQLASAPKGRLRKPAKDSGQLRIPGF